MPLFGLFPKKSKQSATANQVSSVSSSYSPSDDHSSTSRSYKNYVLPDIASPTLSLDSDVHARRGQHSDRPQGRRNDPPVGQHSSARSNGTRSPKVPHDSSKLQPPPSRSAVFGGYAYGGNGQTSRSTLSLPEDALALRLGPPAPPQPTTLSRPRSSSTQEGWGGSEPSFKSSSSKSKIFGWMSFKPKSSTASLLPTSPSIPPLPHRKAPLTPPTTSPEKRSSSKDDDSFKVTSFRHVRPVSPGLSIPYANTARPKNSAKPSPSTLSSPNLSPSSTSSRSALNSFPASRSRHDSVDSDSSQKVTVAAFRQAQARRSSVNLVGSPIHDPSSPSRTEPIDTKPPSRINTPPQTRPSSSLVPDEFKSLFTSDWSIGTPTSSARTIKPGSARSSFATDVEDQSPTGTMTLARQDTITQRTASNGVGGHSRPPPKDSSVPATAPPLRPPRLARPPPPVAKPSVPVSTRNSGKSEDLDFPSRPGSQTSGTLSAYKRSQASVSTPALPSAMKGGRSSRLSAASDTSDEDEEEDSDSDEEDLPLVKLVGPKRPGTSMSVISTATSRTNLASAPVPSPGTNSPSLRPKDPNGLLPPATVKPSQRSRAPLGDPSPPLRRDDELRSTPPTANQRSSVPAKPSAQRSSSTPVPSLPPPAGLSAPTGLNRPSHHDIALRSTSPNARQSANQRSSSVPVTISSDTTPATDLKRPTRDAVSGRSSAYAGRSSRINHSPPSSTGDSSNGKLPLTPRDGSEPSLGGGWYSHKSSRSVVGSSSNVSRLGHTKRPSVSFEIPSRDSKGISPSPEKDAEAQRRERRRSEAKAAIELGVVVNGPPPVIDDQDDTIGQFTTLQQRQAGWEAWQAQTRTSMFSNSNFGMQQLPPTPDASFLAAHQQAMLIAKQTYQMTIAQQALQAANDEWERSSNATAFGMQGSVYGNSAMMGPMNMGMGVGMGMGGLPMFPPAPASMYAGGGSTIVGSRPPSNWGTGSVYGASFGPAPNRRSAVAFPQHGTASDFAGPVAKGRPRTRTAPSNSVAPNALGRSGLHKSSAAPSSWRMP